MDRYLDQEGVIKALNGSPTYLGTVTSTGASATNASTATPFTLTRGSLLLLQADATVYVVSGASVSSSNGVKVAADEKFYLLLTSEQTTLAVISASGTANVKVFRLA
jgi:hypothetical protein